MNSSAKMQSAVGIILLIGVLISLFLVCYGGISFLIAHGNEPMPLDVFRLNSYRTDFQLILGQAVSLSPLSIIEIGLIVLVATQLIRVILLTCFYALARDYWFTFFSFFILMILVYSLGIRA